MSQQEQAARPGKIREKPDEKGYETKPGSANVTRKKGRKSNN
jgi:hypothetical protein